MSVNVNWNNDEITRFQHNMFAYILLEKHLNFAFLFFSLLATRNTLKSNDCS